MPSKTETQLGQPDFHITDIEDLKTLYDRHNVASEIYETNLFPLKRKVARVLSIGYMLQVIL